MTEKRFEATYFDGQYVTDRLEHKDYPVLSEFKYANDLCNLLNDLHQENKDLEHYHDVVLKCLHRTEKDYKEQIKNLQEEIEHLKEDNKMLRINVKKLSEDVAYLRNLK